MLLLLLVVVVVAVVMVVMVVVVVVVAVLAFAFAFLSFSFSFSILTFALLVLDVIDVLVDVANGLTREVHVAVGKEVVHHLMYFWPTMMCSNLSRRCCCIGPRKLFVTVLTFNASLMTGCII